MQRQLTRNVLRALSSTSFRPRVPTNGQRQFCAPAAAVAEGETQGVPTPSTSASVASPKVTALLDDLVNLNMLEVKELTDGLRDRLGIEDTGMMMGGFNPAMFAGMPGAGAAPAAEEEEKPEKAAWDLKLASFDAAKKIAVIKEIRAITGLGLKEAKSLVEDAPKVFKSDVPKEEAEELKNKLKEIGGVVELE